MSKFAGLALNVSTAVRMPIVYPGQDEPIKDKDNNEAYLELLAEDSAAGRAFEKKLTNKTIKAVRTGGRRSKVDDEDPVEFQLDKVLALLTGWYLVGLDGKPIDVPFTQENARELLSDPEMAWLRKAAFTFVGDNANFAKASSKT